MPARRISSIHSGRQVTNIWAGFVPPVEEIPAQILEWKASRSWGCRRWPRSHAASTAFIHGPRSAGVRAEMRLPSMTHASSTHSTPALTMSSRMASTLVALRPFRMPAEIGTQPA